MEMKGDRVGGRFLLSSNISPHTPITCTQQYTFLAVVYKGQMTK